ncbi:P2Y purinoceptor 1 [Hoplias malabaricus]|uniref:P2Y purinoceptor 1 n=1 Tax=Hoplias malabaricus TaxID=27720 RepID=UPI00346321A1
MASNQTNISCKVNMHFTYVFLPTVYVMVFIFGLLANCFGLKTVYNNWTKLGNVNIFAMNLCIADILYLLTLPLLVTYYAKRQQWIFSQFLCKTTRFLFSINLYGSIGFLMWISVYRYLAIIHPLKVKGRIKLLHSTGIALLVWILVFILGLPDVYFDKSPSNMTKCFDTTLNEAMENYLIYSTAQTFTGFVIPLVVIVCCYGHVAVVLATRKDSGDAMLKLRCLRLVVILALLFSICYIPYHIFRNLNLQTRVWKLKQSHCRTWYAHVYIGNQVSNGLVCLNSVINPLVYLFNSDKLLVSCFTCVKLQPDSTIFTRLNSPREIRESAKTELSMTAHI